VQELIPLIDAVQLAQKLTRRIQQEALASLDKTSADHSEPVTIADYGAQAIIARALQAYFPDVSVLSEESSPQFLELTNDYQQAQILAYLSEFLETNVTLDDVIQWLDHGKGDETPQHYWSLDPIDGTKGYINGRHYAIGLGYVKDGKPAGAIMACPAYGLADDATTVGKEGGAIFVAWDGKAYRIEAGHTEKFTMPETDNLIIAQSYEKSHASKSDMAKVCENLAIQQVRELDSMEKYALVAHGDATLYLRLPRKGSTYKHKIWDHLPGVALIEASGGIATDIDGSPLIFNQGVAMPNEAMIACPKSQHERVLQAIKTVMNEGDGA